MEKKLGRYAKCNFKRQNHLNFFNQSEQALRHQVITSNERQYSTQEKGYMK